MKALTLEEVRDAVHGRWLARGSPQAVQSVGTDSRQARAGELFVALRGQRLDGHRFLADAAKAGCPAALVALNAEIPPEVLRSFGGGVIGVPDTTKALGELGAFHRRHAAAAVIAVTGSNGKTTVKRMVHHILSRRLKGSCSPKSYNNQIGVPLTLLAVAPADDYVVCELGSNAPGEIAQLAAMAGPDLAVITSIAPAHLEKLGSLERVAAEKASILAYLADDGLGVVWGDSDLLRRAVKAHGRRVIRFGESAEADLRLTGFEPMGPRQRFELNGRVRVDLPLPGRHNALNALAAIAVAQRFGFDQREAAGCLADFAGESMRLEWQELPGGTIINDAYNANPASLAAAADVLAGCGAARKVLIAGDMRELGEETEELHRQAGRQIAAQGVDLLIAVGALGRFIAEGAAEAGGAAEAFESVAAAASALPALVRRGDVVLLKGSRAMAMEELLAPLRAALAPGGNSESCPTAGGGGEGPTT